MLPQFLKIVYTILHLDDPGLALLPTIWVE
jgi:hypothetical protein